jgi:hypothetical protein
MPLCGLPAINPPVNDENPGPANRTGSPSSCSIRSFVSMNGAAGAKARLHVMLHGLVTADAELKTETLPASPAL